MLHNDLVDVLSENLTSLSDNAVDVLEAIIDGYVLEDEDDFEVALSEELDNQFMYWADAFDYLKDNSICNFEEAINELGATSIEQFAYYYLEQEIREIL